MDTSRLKVHGIFGFEGTVPSGVKYHPDRKHLIYPIGSTILVKNLVNDDIFFLRGHDGPVSCVSLSRSGRYIASGQTTHMGFKASVIIWDFYEKKILHKFVLHKVCVQCLSFSKDEQYLVSVGGSDDNNIIIWSVETGKAICGNVSPDDINCVDFFNKSNEFIACAGKYSLKVWQIDYVDRKIVPYFCNLGQYKRIITCMKIDRNDEYAYCGTTSGDVICVQVQGARNFKYSGPKKRIELGVKCIGFTAKGNVVVGGGNGILYILGRNNLFTKKKVKLNGAITSITGSPSGVYYAGTEKSEIYHLDKMFEATLFQTCHSSRVNDICFPDRTSEIFATCSNGDIRLWSSKKLKEMVRIELPGLECNCVCFSHRGHLIIGGWSDGKIRAFGPESGELKFVIHEAHKVLSKGTEGLKGVTALQMLKDDLHIISGGSDGQLRIWRLRNGKQTLEVSMKQHTHTINQVCLNNDDTQCVSASDDGSCIIWNLQKYTRENIMYQTTNFKGACWLNDESQILTSGTNKLVTYWDAFDCSAIRELEASEGEINSVDISGNGASFCCAGNDQKLSLFDYDEGEVISEGIGHSGNITKCKFSPDDKFICSCANDGSIIIWENLQIEEKFNEEEDQQQPGEYDDEQQRFDEESGY